ncbi:long-chain fatty acid transporter [Acinetobacter sp. ANC 4779]|uniref:outer membrane protein transport protein n=1 Tax=Acinetobacter sp. ANC 4779 TaxID=2529848 RepID=UPI00103E822A|nr:outer membrane protein transport protein [Acinetobacter sp. ANC 4779]TCB52679.1 long-chain fatty acid transporter [Acinetobacter sp. ANC 4779]
MKLKTLSTAILLATVPMTGAFAAALDRSGQSIAAFLQPGNYFEAGISVLDPTVEGQEAGASATQRNISDMAGDYYFPSAALKFQPTNKFSFGILYDQPFGADAEYTGNNVFVSDSTNTILGQSTLNSLANQTVQNTLAANGITTQAITSSPTTVIGALGVQAGFSGAALQTFVQNQVNAAGGNAVAAAQTAYDTLYAGGLAQAQAQIAGINGLLGTGNTKVEVNTQNLSFIAGFQPTENWNIYAGPVYQTVKGNLSLRGQAYSIFNGYDASIKETHGVGWLAGLAFQIPDIALKASLTYRSEIDHDVNINESIPTLPALTLLPNGAAAAAGIAAASGETKITTPQSVNLDFQTGIMANTVAFANVRWVDWSSFSIRPYKFGLLSDAVGPLVQRPNGFNLVEYSDDQISATVGVGRKLSEQWAGNLSVGWDSGAGNPVSTLGPTEGYWNVGLGLQFSPAPNYFIAGGVKYFWLGDAKAQTGAQAGGNEYVANFEDNNAIAYGMKIGYRF